MGLIDNISLICPSSLNVDMDALINEVSVICSGTYNVLFEVMKVKLKALTSSLGEELYLTFRSLCQNPDIKKDVWFAGISENHGFRLVDSTIASELIVSLPNAFGRSRASLGAELIDTALPIEGLLMKNVFNVSEAIDVDSDQADYGRKRSSYFEAMVTLYGGTKFTLYPIYSEGMWAVLALSGTKWRGEVSDILSENKEEFLDICVRSRNRVREAMRKISKRTRSSDWSGWGTLIGAASAEYTKNMAGM